MALESDVLRVIQDYGQELTLRRTSGGTYDPTTGGTTSTTTTDYTIQGKFYQYKENLIDGSLVQVGDRKLFVAAKDLTVEPKPGDQILGSRETGKVVRVQYIEEGTTVLGYQLQVRSA